MLPFDSDKTSTQNDINNITPKNNASATETETGKGWFSWFRGSNQPPKNSTSTASTLPPKLPQVEETPQVQVIPKGIELGFGTKLVGFLGNKILGTCDEKDHSLEDHKKMLSDCLNHPESSFKLQKMIQTQAAELFKRAAEWVQGGWTEGYIKDNQDLIQKSIEVNLLHALIHLIEEVQKKSPQLKLTQDNLFSAILEMVATRVKETKEDEAKTILSIAFPNGKEDIIFPSKNSFVDVPYQIYSRIETELPKMINVFKQTLEKGKSIRQEYLGKINAYPDGEKLVTLVQILTKNLGRLFEFFIGSQEGNISQLMHGMDDYYQLIVMHILVHTLEGDGGQDQQVLTTMIKNMLVEVIQFAKENKEEVRTSLESYRQQLVEIEEKYQQKSPEKTKAVAIAKESVNKVLHPLVEKIQKRLGIDEKELKKILPEEISGFASTKLGDFIHLFAFECCRDVIYPEQMEPACKERLNAYPEFLKVLEHLSQQIVFAVDQTLAGEESIAGEFLKDTLDTLLAGEFQVDSTFFKTPINEIFSSQDLMAELDGFNANWLQRVLVGLLANLASSYEDLPKADFLPASIFHFIRLGCSKIENFEEVSRHIAQWNQQKIYCETLPEGEEKQKGLAELNTNKEKLTTLFQPFVNEILNQGDWKTLENSLVPAMLRNKFRDKIASKLLPELCFKIFSDTFVFPSLMEEEKAKLKNVDDIEFFVDGLLKMSFPSIQGSLNDYSYLFAHKLNQNIANASLNIKEESVVGGQIQDIFQFKDETGKILGTGIGSHLKKIVTLAIQRLSLAYKGENQEDSLSKALIHVKDLINQQKFNPNLIKEIQDYRRQTKEVRQLDLELAELKVQAVKKTPIEIDQKLLDKIDEVAAKRSEAFWKLHPAALEKIKQEQLEPQAEKEKIRIFEQNPPLHDLYNSLLAHMKPLVDELLKDMGFDSPEKLPVPFFLKPILFEKLKNFLLPDLCLEFYRIAWGPSQKQLSENLNDVIPRASMKLSEKFREICQRETSSLPAVLAESFARNGLAGVSELKFKKIINNIASEKDSTFWNVLPQFLENRLGFFAKHLKKGQEKEIVRTLVTAAVKHFEEYHGIIDEVIKQYAELSEEDKKSRKAEFSNRVFSPLVEGLFDKLKLNLPNLYGIAFTGSKIISSLKGTLTEYCFDVYLDTRSAILEIETSKKQLKESLLKEKMTEEEAEESLKFIEEGLEFTTKKLQEKIKGVLQDKEELSELVKALQKTYGGSEYWYQALLNKGIETPGVDIILVGISESVKAVMLKKLADLTRVHSIKSLPEFFYNEIVDKAQVYRKALKKIVQETYEEKSDITEAELIEKLRPETLNIVDALLGIAEIDPKNNFSPLSKTLWDNLGKEFVADYISKIYLQSIRPLEPSKVKENLKELIAMEAGMNPGQVEAFSQDVENLLKDLGVNLQEKIKQKLEDLPVQVSEKLLENRSFQIKSWFKEATTEICNSEQTNHLMERIPEIVQTVMIKKLVDLAQKKLTKNAKANQTVLKDLPIYLSHLLLKTINDSRSKLGTIVQNHPELSEEQLRELLKEATLHSVEDLFKELDIQLEKDVRLPFVEQIWSAFGKDLLADSLVDMYWKTTKVYRQASEEALSQVIPDPRLRRNVSWGFSALGEIIRDAAKERLGIAPAVEEKRKEWAQTLAEKMSQRLKVSDFSKGKLQEWVRDSIPDILKDEQLELLLNTLPEMVEAVISNKMIQWTQKKPHEDVATDIVFMILDEIDKNKENLENCQRDPQKLKIEFEKIVMQLFKEMEINPQEDLPVPLAEEIWDSLGKDVVAEIFTGIYLDVTRQVHKGQFENVNQCVRGLMKQAMPSIQSSLANYSDLFAESLNEKILNSKLDQVGKTALGVQFNKILTSQDNRTNPLWTKVEKFLGDIMIGVVESLALSYNGQGDPLSQAIMHFKEILEAQKLPEDIMERFQNYVRRGESIKLLEEEIKELKVKAIQASSVGKTNDPLLEQIESKQKILDLKQDASLKGEYQELLKIFKPLSKQLLTGAGLDQPEKLPVPALAQMNSSLYRLLEESLLPDLCLEFYRFAWVSSTRVFSDELQKDMNELAKKGSDALKAECLSEDSKLPKFLAGLFADRNIGGVDEEWCKQWLDQLAKEERLWKLLPQFLNNRLGFIYEHVIGKKLFGVIFKPIIQYFKSNQNEIENTLYSYEVLSEDAKRNQNQQVYKSLNAEELFSGLVDRIFNDLGLDDFKTYGIAFAGPTIISSLKDTLARYCFEFYYDSRKPVMSLEGNKKAFKDLLTSQDVSDEEAQNIMTFLENGLGFTKEKIEEKFKELFADDEIIVDVDVVDYISSFAQGALMSKFLSLSEKTPIKDLPNTLYEKILVNIKACKEDLDKATEAVYNENPKIEKEELLKKLKNPALKIVDELMKTIDVDSTQNLLPCTDTLWQMFGKNLLADFVSKAYLQATTIYRDDYVEKLQKAVANEAGITEEQVQNFSRNLQKLMLSLGVKFENTILSEENRKQWIRNIVSSKAVTETGLQDRLEKILDGVNESNQTQELVKAIPEMVQIVLMKKLVDLTPKGGSVKDVPQEIIKVLLKSLNTHRVALDKLLIENKILNEEQLQEKLKPEVKKVVEELFNSLGIQPENDLPLPFVEQLWDGFGKDLFVDFLTGLYLRTTKVYRENYSEKLQQAIENERGITKKQAQKLNTDLRKLILGLGVNLKDLVLDQISKQNREQWLNKIVDNDVVRATGLQEWLKWILDGVCEIEQAQELVQAIPDLIQTILIKKLVDLIPQGGSVKNVPQEIIKVLLGSLNTHRVVLDKILMENKALNEEQLQEKLKLAMTDIVEELFNSLGIQPENDVPLPFVEQLWDGLGKDLVADLLAGLYLGTTKVYRENYSEKLQQAIENESGITKSQAQELSTDLQALILGLGVSLKDLVLDRISKQNRGEWLNKVVDSNAVKATGLQEWLKETLDGVCESKQAQELVKVIPEMVLNILIKKLVDLTPKGGSVKDIPQEIIKILLESLNKHCTTLNKIIVENEWLEDRKLQEKLKPEVKKIVNELFQVLDIQFEKDVSLPFAERLWNDFGKDVVADLLAGLYLSKTKVYLQASEEVLSQSIPDKGQREHLIRGLGVLGNLVRNVVQKQLKGMDMKTIVSSLPVSEFSKNKLADWLDVSLQKTLEADSSKAVLAEIPDMVVAVISRKLIQCGERDDLPIQPEAGESPLKYLPANLALILLKRLEGVHKEIFAKNPDISDENLKKVLKPKMEELVTTLFDDFKVNLEDDLPIPFAQMLWDRAGKGAVVEVLTGLYVDMTKTFREEQQHIEALDIRFDTSDAKEHVPLVDAADKFTDFAMDHLKNKMVFRTPGLDKGIEALEKMLREQGEDDSATYLQTHAQELKNWMGEKNLKKLANHPMTKESLFPAAKADIHAVMMKIFDNVTGHIEKIEQKNPEMTLQFVYTLLRLLTDHLKNVYGAKSEVELSQMNQNIYKQMATYFLQIAGYKSAADLSEVPIETREMVWNALNDSLGPELIKTLFGTAFEPAMLNSYLLKLLQTLNEKLEKVSSSVSQVETVAYVPNPERQEQCRELIKALAALVPGSILAKLTSLNVVNQLAAAQLESALHEALKEWSMVKIIGEALVKGSENLPTEKLPETEEEFAAAQEKAKMEAEKLPQQILREGQRTARNVRHSIWTLFKNKWNAIQLTVDKWIAKHDVGGVFSGLKLVLDKVCHFIFFDLIGTAVMAISSIPLNWIWYYYEKYILSKQIENLRKNLVVPKNRENLGLQWMDAFMKAFPT